VSSGIERLVSATLGNSNPRTWPGKRLGAFPIERGWKKRVRRVDFEGGQLAAIAEGHKRGKRVSKPLIEREREGERATACGR